MSVLGFAKRAVERAFDLNIISGGELEPVFEQIHLRRFFDHFKVDCVFDVGANAGQYAQMLRRNVGFKGSIISFEPIPAMAELLRRAAKGNPNWRIEQVALDREIGIANFSVMANSTFSSLHATTNAETDLFDAHVRVVEQTEVRKSTLALEFVKYQADLGFKRPFLKMDTQGHDVEVAMGAKGKLREFVGLQSELAIKRIYEGAPTIRESLDFFTKQGFDLSALVPNTLGHFPRLIEIDCIMYRADLVS